VAVRRNAIVETLTNAPKTFEPIFARKPNKDIDAGPWCEGFCAAMKLRLSAWAPLSNPADINHGLLLPILFHCLDDQGRPMLGPSKQRADTDQFRRTAYKHIPVAVEEMRQYWMPKRFKSRS
jgi:uncharacterized protein